MVRSVEVVLGKENATRIDEVLLDGKARVTATTNSKVRKGWRVMAIAGKKVKGAENVRMALGMAQSKGRPYKVRFVLPEKVTEDAEGVLKEDVDEKADDDSWIIEEIDEEEWEGDSGDDEVLWANVLQVEAAERVEREAAEAAVEAERAAAIERARLAATSATRGVGKKKVLNPFVGKI